MRFPTPNRRRLARRSDGFTRIDLIATVLLVMLLGLLTVPTLTRASQATIGSSCIDNQRLICSAWQQYAADHSDRLVNNFNLADTYNTINNGQFDNWTVNVVDWTTKSDNTNLTYFQQAKLFPYLQGNNLAFKCAADTFRSSAQIAAQWPNGRIRSYSMNACMGKTGVNDSSVNNGISSWVPGKRQFLKTASIPNPGNVFVFLDEHPDSINDGFFVENPSVLQWGDIPASQHNGGCGFGFADGHGEIHIWTYNATKVPVKYNFNSPPPMSPSTSADYVWLTSRMAVDPTALAVRLRANGAEIAWSALPTTYVLEANLDLSSSNWTPIDPQPTLDYGTRSAIVDSSNAASFFRLRK